MKRAIEETVDLATNVEDLDLSWLEPAPGAESDRLLDADRLSEILRLRPFDGEVAELLGDVIAGLQRDLDAHIAMVDVVLNDAMVVVSGVGALGWVAESKGVPAEWAFCTTVVRQGEAYSVSNAKEHEIAGNSPLVTRDGVASYLGVPLISSGQPIGAVCVLSGFPEAFDPSDIAVLQRAADEILRRLEKRLLDEA